MSGQRHIRLPAFVRRESGAALVEFGMIVPLLILFFAVIIEGGRIAWIYQSAAGGVRDASRMVARMAPADLCVTGSGTGGFNAMVTQMVTQSLSGNSVVPHGATVTSVTPTFKCVTGNYRGGDAPVVEVRAELTINYLQGGVFGLFGTALGPLTTELADQSRVYGN